MGGGGGGAAGRRWRSALKPNSGSSRFSTELRHNEECDPGGASVTSPECPLTVHPKDGTPLSLETQKGKRFRDSPIMDSIDLRVRVDGFGRV